VVVIQISNILFQRNATSLRRHPVHNRISVVMFSHKAGKALINIALLRASSTVHSRHYHRKFKVLDGRIDLTNHTVQGKLKENEALEADLSEKMEKIKLGGGKRAIDRHTQLNKKVLVRDRLEKLLDKDYPFLELAQLAGHNLEYGDVPAAGSVMGIGSISGQLCVITANDATVKGGTIYPIGVKKQLRGQEIALENRLPCVYIVDSGGAFLPLQSELFLPGGRTFCNEAIMSSMGIPQVCVVAGSCTAGAAYIPTMADETVIIDKIGTLFLGGPPLVQAATGDVVTPEELGGAGLHCKESGCTDYFALSEDDAIEDCKDIMASLNMPKSLIPQEFYEEPMFEVEELKAIASPYPDKSDMDIYKIIARIVDGSRFREFKPLFGPTLTTGFCHIHGILTGIVANNGALLPDACLKGAHFVEICCQRRIPIVFFQNISHPKDLGHEASAILLKEKAKMMSIVANSQVPKVTVIIGNSFGMDNFVMCGRSMSPRFMFSWPAARIAMVDPELVDKVNPDSSWSSNMIENECPAYFGTARMWDDGIILPQETRNVLGLCLKASLKHQEPNFSLKSVLRM